MENLSDTIEFMQSKNYRERFLAEYHQTKIRYEKLKSYCNRIEACELTLYDDNVNLSMPLHECPLSVLREQQRAMGEYLHILEIRAIIEDIELC